MTSSLQKRDRRRFLRDSALATAALAGAPAGALAGAPAPRAGARRAAQRFGQITQPAVREWVARLRYEDLPAAVVDRAKGLTLQNLASALLGSQMPAGRQAIKFVIEEEDGRPQRRHYPRDRARRSPGAAPHSPTPR